MPTNNDLPKGEGKQENNPGKKWYTKKEAMKFLDVGKTTFYKYIKDDGLKVCGTGHKLKFLGDDLEDFLLSFRKLGEAYVMNMNLKVDYNRLDK